MNLTSIQDLQRVVLNVTLYYTIVGKVQDLHTHFWYAYSVFVVSYHTLTILIVYSGKVSPYPHLL